MDYAAAAIIVLASVVGVILTILTLPGTWLILLVAGLCWLWRPELFSVWTFVGALVMAIAAEIIEFLASAVGASRTGGSRSAALWSIVGGLIGALGGTVVIPIPIIGTIVGAAAGAGAAAFLAERGVHGRGWRHSTYVGTGAAAGRLFAIVVKGAFAAAIGATLSVAALVP